MKAIRIYEFGGPEVMKIVEVDRPVPAADEILVKVFAASVKRRRYFRILPCSRTIQRRVQGDAG